MSYGNYCNYENGISFPTRSMSSNSFFGNEHRENFSSLNHPQSETFSYASQKVPINPIYGEEIRKLSQDTDNNLRRLRAKLAFIDPGYAIGIDPYYGTVSYHNKMQQMADEVYGQPTKSVWQANHSEPVNKYCYLCTTLDEHQRHLAQRGLQMKPKHIPRPRTVYVVRTKPQAKSLEDDDVDNVIFSFMVKTGNEDNAGTNANVFVQLKGSRGLTKKQQLKHKGSSDNNFEQGTTERFVIKSPDVGDLKLLYIEHDGKGKKHSWLLDNVIVTNETTGDMWEFACQEWISRFHGDCTARKVLKADWLKTVKRDYRVTVVTGDQKFAGTDSNVFITFYGHKLASSKMELVDKKKNTFERGQTDIFKVTADDVGKILKIRIEHDNSGAASGWFLEKVIIESLEGRKEKYVFLCRQWLATNEGDCQIYKILSAKKAGGSDEEDSKEYIVTVKTGDKDNAGTNAHVFLTLYGKTDSSDRIELRDSKKRCFQRHSVDKFNITVEDIGLINKIKIEHDNSGTAPGWFLEEITIQNTYDEREFYSFPCRQWLSSDEGDRQTWKMLTVQGKEKTGKKPNLKDYEVLVVTSDIRNAGTDANVFITLHGTKGYSEKYQLRGPGNLFERGQTDMFTVTSEDIGRITKLSLEHDNTGISAGWHVEKVIVTNKQNSREQYIFPCKQWLATDEGDGKISRTLTASDNKPANSNSDDEATKDYDVFVTTSNKINAGTDANVFLTMYGSKGTSDRLKLTGKGNLFEKGNTDRFKLAIPDVGTIKQIRIEHDNSGPGPAWHLNQVRVVNTSSKESYVFRCDQWLATDEGDGKISRILQAQKSADAHEISGQSIKHEISGQSKKHGTMKQMSTNQIDKGYRAKSPSKKNNTKDYEVIVTTSNIKNAGTDANVFVTLYGTKGTSDKIALTGDENYFEKGSTDSFSITVDDIGTINKIRIEHDNSGFGSGWHLEEVQITNNNDDRETYTFQCGQWLAEDEGDGKTYKILVPEKTQKFNEVEDKRKSGKGSQVKLNKKDDTALRKSANKNNIIDYEVQVKTSDVWNAGTDANVFLTLYGNKDSSDKIALTGNGNLFERGKIDSFFVSVDDLGTLNKIRIEHDNSGTGSAWHLQEVRITNCADDRETYLFRCDQWLADDEGDKKTFKILYPDKPTKSFKDNDRSVKQLPADKGGSRLSLKDKSNTLLRDEPVDYEVIVTTSDIRNAGTDANVFITLCGTKGTSDQIALTGTGNLFEKGSSHSFRISVDDIGIIKTIRIEHDNSGIGSGWHLKEVRLVNSSDRRESYLFHCNEWLDENEGDKRTYKILKAEKSFNEKDLSVDRRRSSVSPYSDMAQKRMSKFTEYKVEVFTGREQVSAMTANVFLTIYGFDETSEKIPLKSTDKKCFTKSQCDSFMVKTDKRLGKVEKIKIEHDSKGTQPNWFLEKVIITDTEDNLNSIEFPCSHWLSNTKGDSKTFKILYPSKSSSTLQKQNSSMDNRRKSLVENGPRLKVQVLTGNIKNAGTTANVFITIFGSEDTSEKLPLKVMGKTCFEKGQLDTFIIDTKKPFGKIEKIKIEHDSKGSQPDWFLEKVIIIDSNFPDHPIGFTCHKWLSATEGDFKTYKLLYPTTSGVNDDDNNNSYRRKSNAIRDYEVIVTTSDKRNAGTDANVFLTLYGTKGESDKIPLKGTGNLFEKGSSDSFQISVDDIGVIDKIRIEHDDSGIQSNWHLKEVRLINSRDERESYLFICDNWLAKDDGDKRTYKILKAVKISNEKDFSIERRSSMNPQSDVALRRMSQSAGKDQRQDQPLLYEVSVTTGNVKNAGTDARVFIQFLGADGESVEHQLQADKSAFEQGKTDTFKVQANNVGELTRLKLRHDNTGLGAGWFVDKVIVKRFLSMKEIQEKLKTLQREKRNNRTMNDNRKMSLGSARYNDEIVSTRWEEGRIPYYDEYEFPCNQWFASDEGDKQIERILKVKSVTSYYRTV